MIDVLPAPVAPTIATFSPSRDVERDAAQHPVAGLVGEPHVAELDLAAHAREVPRRPAVSRTSDALVQDQEDALGRGHRLLHDVVLLAQVADRLEEALDVLDEGHQPPTVSTPVEYLRAAVPDDRRQRDGRGDAHQRPEQREVQHAAQVRLQQIVVGGVELLRTRPARG